MFGIIYSRMECEFNGKKIKYDEGKLYVWREKQGNQKLKNPDWYEMKGANNKDGYRRVMINYKLLLYHRVVYFVHNENWNIYDSSMDNQIDHIDRDRSNNNIENLRVVTHSQNMWNQDCKGYYFHKPSGKYVAQIVVNRKRNLLGCFESEDDARNAYLNAKPIHHHIPQANH